MKHVTEQLLPGVNSLNTQSPQLPACGALVPLFSRCGDGL